MPLPAWSSLSRKRRRWIQWLAGALLLYLLIGFFVLPPIIRSVAQKQLSGQLERAVSIERVKLNPLTLSATIRGLVIKDKDGASPFVSWDEVYVNFQLASLFGKPWIFREVRTSQPSIHAQVNADGRLNFADLIEKFSTNAPSGPPKQLGLRIDHLEVAGAVISFRREPQAVASMPVEPPAAANPTNRSDAILLLLHSVTNALGALASSTNSLALTLRQVTVTNCSLDLEDLANPRPARLKLDEVRLSAKNISNLPGTNWTASFSLRWNTNGAMQSEMTASVAPPTADIHLSWQNLELRPIDPYLDSKLNVFIVGSKLGMDGRIRLRSTSALPEVTFTGNAWLNEFNSIDGVLSEGLLSWNSVVISGIEAQLNPPVVVIGQIGLNGVKARTVIETNRTINLLAALRLTNAAPATNPVAQVEKPQPPGNTLLSTNALSGFPLEKFVVKSTVVSNAQVDFTDRSVVPNVNMAVRRINGSISGLSSDVSQLASLKLTALVDDVGPVEITGSINPFREDLTNEVKITARDIDLTPTSSYAGKFAGYRIAKGKLNLTLAYYVRGRSLRSENLIVLDQFTLGEKVDSPDATHLPVRLAIAVLKDREGKIVVDVPIEGSLDDPQFKLRKVIWRAVGNIFIKAATSPFAVLGAVFGGRGEEISYQDFAPGSAELSVASREKLDALTKGLYERPGLELEIAGSVESTLDRDGLRAVNLERQLRARKWQSLRKSDRAENPPDQVTIPPEERPAMIKRLYAEGLSKGLIKTSNSTTNNPRRPSAGAPLTDAGEPERGAMALLRKETPKPAMDASSTTAVTDPFELGLLESMEITESEFETLAAARARAVRDYVLQSGKVEAQRIFLSADQSGRVRKDGSRVYLQLR